MSRSTARDEYADGRRANATIYTKLPADSSSIRLIRLLPNATPGISCELFQSTLQEARNQYKALSYTWGESENGDSSPRAVIRCNNATVRVKANLYAALRRLQQRKQPVVLWVDSLCINQADDTERTHQVGMMRDIYANCTEVIIWLGIRGRSDDLGESMEVDDSEEEDAGRRVRFHGDERDLGKLNSYLYQLSNGLRKLTPESRDVYGAFCVISMLSQGVLPSKIWYLRHLDHSPPIFKGMTTIMEKSWWRRIWVVQETVVAQRATVCYSDISIPWEAFSNAASCYETGRISENLGSVSYMTYGGPLARFCRVISEIDTTRRDWTRIEPMALLPTLRKFRARDSSDRRDKVFALVGLVRSWGSDAPLVPDYGRGVWKVFWTTTIRLISGSKSLSALAGTLGRREDTGNKPSWITDWSQPPQLNEYDRLNNLALYNASSDVVERVRIHGSTLLETKGYFVDRVVSVGRDSDEVAAESLDNAQGNSSSGGGVLQTTVSEWSRSFEWGDNDDYALGGGLGDAFWRTICGDVLYVPAVDKGGPEMTVGDGGGEFRRAGPEGLRAYRNWRRKVDPSNNRRTSIIGGTMQESMGMDDDQQGKNEFQLAVEIASGSRKFFRTKRGYIGTGPWSLRTGDGVFILLGSRVPLILRTSTDTRRCRDSKVGRLILSTEEENARIDLKGESATNQIPRQETTGTTRCNEAHLVCYKVVGDAYVHGIMDGELVWEDQKRKVLRKPQSIYLT